jgi:hypothetical protein
VGFTARWAVVSLVVLAAMNPFQPAQAKDAPSDFVKSLNYGVGLRVSAGTTTMSGASDTVGLFALDVRPYISGQVTPFLKFTGNLDLNNGDQGRIHVLDAVAQLEPDDLFNIWMGRFLPPSDRANLSGPYYQNAWNYPTTVNGFPSIYAGRADGAAVWGQVGKGVFKYQAGIFTLDTRLPLGQAIYAARLVFNALDPEPGYYNSSTYYGKKDVLAIGATFQYKKTPAGGGAPETSLGAFNLDGLFEKRLGRDTVSLEGAYYNFNQGANSGNQGWSYFALVSYLFGTKVGPGKIQPMARYQYAAPPGGGDGFKTVDGGLNYIMDGHNTRAALVVQNVNPPGAVPSLWTAQLGIQIQE